MSGLFEKDLRIIMQRKRYSLFSFFWQFLLGIVKLVLNLFLGIFQCLQ